MNSKFDYSIRNAVAEDISAMADIEAACFPAAEAATYESLKSRFEVFPDCFFVVTDEEDNVIGFINGAVTDSIVIPDEMYENVSLHNPDGKYQTVFGINTLPKFRKRGIGSAMLRKMIEHAKSQGRKGLILACKEEKKHFYTSLGLKCKGKSDSIHGGAVWFDMILEF